MLDIETVNDAKYSPAAVNAGLNDPVYLKKVVDRLVDPAPDVYSYALPGGPSGRFVFLDTTVVLFPQRQLQVRRLAGSPAQGTSDGFQISTEAGVRYQFQAIETTKPNPNNFGSSMGTYASAWQLTRIISTNNADTLRLYYSKHGGDAPGRCAMTNGEYAVNGAAIDYTFHNIVTFPAHHEAQYLDSITSRTAHLILKRDNTSHVLQRVQLFATAGRRESKRIDLTQSYFVGGLGADRRLRLDQVQESAAGIPLPAYRFRYHDESVMPPRRSGAQDHWGYYNGAIGNGDGGSGTPALLDDERLGVLAANREPDYDYAVLGALKQVTYPTGGTTSLDYELGDHDGGGFIPKVGYDQFDVATGYNQNYLQPAPGTSPVKYVTAATIPFEVPEKGDMRLVLSRTHYYEYQTSGGNTYRDFNIWKVLPTGDSLVTTSNMLGAYQSFDPNDGRAFTFPLSPGSYRATVYCEVHEANSGLDLYVPRTVIIPAPTEPGPGIRVTRTATTARGMPAVVRAYKYNLADSVGGSSCQILMATGIESRTYTVNDRFIISGPAIKTIEYISSDNTAPSNDFNTYPYYYARVTEHAGPNRQGATISHFQHQEAQFNDVVLTERQVYRQADQLQLVQRERYAYFTDHTVAFPTLRAYLSYEDIRGPSQNLYVSTPFLILGAFTAPALTEQQRYDEQGRISTTITRSTYHQQRLVRSATQANGNWIIQRHKYLTDYNPTSAPVAALRVHNFNPVIETQTWRRNLSGTDSTLTAGQLTFYDPAWRLPVSAWSLRLDRPALGPNAEQRVNGYYTAFQSDTRYHLDESVTYHPTSGLLLQRQRPHGTTTSYVWGYDQDQVVAQVENATYSQVQTALGPAALAQLQGHTPGSDSQVRSLLAPLRTQLPAARSSIFTYLPLVGMTSQTDASGRTTFFEYDALGRLLRTRDEQGRLLTQQEYYYAR